MFNRLVSIPINTRFFKLDLFEVEDYITERYEKMFNEAPLKVDARKYPSEIDITIYVSKITDQNRKFRNTIWEDLNNQGLSVLVLLKDKSMMPDRSQKIE